MISRTTFCSAQPAAMRAARTGPMPSTSRRRPGVGFDDVEHGFAEGLHQPLRVGRTDAADHAGAEVALDALDRRGRRRLQEVGPELQAVRAIVGPGADGLDPFPGRDHRGVTDDGDEVALPTRLETQHAEAALLVVERHPLDEPGEVLGRRGRRQGGGETHIVSVA